MNDATPKDVGRTDEQRPAKTYERPRVVWEEEYKPTAFGLSCAKQSGNPACNPGPISA
jgi:hypothetical protein